MRNASLTATGLCLVVVSGVCAATAAAGTFPGSNGSLAFAGTDGSDLEIFVVDADGQTPTPLTSNSPPGPADDYQPSWSGDGERIAFTSDRDGDAEIFVMNADGSNRTQLTFNSVKDDEPTFSPDGRSIAFIRAVGGNDQIHFMDADGQNQVQLTTAPGGASGPAISPDGKRIAFASGDASGYTQVFVMDADGANPTPLTSVPMIESFQPTFLPDGQRILFTRTTTAGHDDLYTMATDGSDEVPVSTAPTNDFQAVFSPDGQRIVFTRFTSMNYNLYAIDPSGTNETPFVTRPEDELNPDWQPLNPPACDVTGPPKQRSFKAVSVTVTCPNENASVVATGEGKAPKPPKLAIASKAKRFTLEPTTVEVQPGQPTTLILGVPKKGKKALKKAAKAGKNGKATVTTTATDDFGETAQDSLAVKFKRKK
jgi:dipeptidyl aminopeptidase/acylaminoacyl peptidase